MNTTVFLEVDKPDQFYALKAPVLESECSCTTSLGRANGGLKTHTNFRELALLRSTSDSLVLNIAVNDVHTTIVGFWVYPRKGWFQRLAYRRW